MERFPHNSRRSRTGFSLLELVLVVVMVALLAGLAVPRYANSLNYYHADLSAKRVAADLTLARTTAWTTGSHRTVTFVPSAGRYTLTAVRALDSAAADSTVNLSDSPYSSQISTDIAGQTVIFDGYGVPDKGGTITVTSGSFQKTILLDASSGIAKVQ